MSFISAILQLTGAVVDATKAIRELNNCLNDDSPLLCEKEVMKFIGVNAGYWKQIKDARLIPSVQLVPGGKKLYYLVEDLVDFIISRRTDPRLIDAEIKERQMAEVRERMTKKSKRNDIEEAVRLLIERRKAS